MQKELINQVIYFMRHSNLNTSFPDIVALEIDDEGKQSTSQTLKVNLFGSKLTSNELLSRLLLFSALDAFIDTTHPHLEGESFRKRYNNLPTSTEREVVLKEIYRITKNIRNAMVHNLSKISETNEGYSISYSHKKTLFSISYNSRAISLLNTLTIIFIRNSQAIDSYLDNYIYTYYQKLKYNISEFSDDIKKPLATVEPETKIKTGRRYRIKVPEDCWQPDTGNYIIKRAKIDEHEKSSACDEFLIETDIGIALIPGEAFSGNIIHRKLISKWILSPNNYLAQLR